MNAKEIFNYICPLLPVSCLYGNDCIATNSPVKNRTNGKVLSKAAYYSLPDISYDDSYTESNATSSVSIGKPVFPEAQLLSPQEHYW